MAIDWIMLSQIAGPIVGSIVGFGASRYFGERERLIAFYGHIASHSVATGDTNNTINTHAVVIRNKGSRTATNVRISHNYLPNVKIYPETDYDIRDLPDGGRQLIIPRMPPKQQFTISYLYFPPWTYDQINSVIESDAGLAKVVNVTLQQVFPRWMSNLAAASMVVGAVAFLYGVFEAFRLLAS